MQKYELVLMLDYKGQDSDRKDLLSKFEKSFKDNILKKDDIGLKELKFQENFMFVWLWKELISKRK